MDAHDLARHRRALELCGAAAELTDSERADFVGQWTADDPELAALLAALLAKLRDDEPAAAAPLERPIAGSMFAGYRLVRLLGEGGMGAVYLAQRDAAGVTREVALKTLQRLRPSAEEVARFRAEQQALAQLHHPYIAALVDVGTTDDGAPFLAMEYVPGVDIVGWCDAHQATLAERIALWEKVCDAVAYAHRNLVVHRDIKPANILVSDDGLPKLLDFGIAKLLEGGSNELTAAFAQHLTLDYATPERVLRNTVSTTDDIYALGVLLYELIVGVRPFTRGGLSLEVLMQTVGERRAPSFGEMFARLDMQARSRLASARRRTVRHFRSDLRGDLDVVVGQALHIDPARRYGTVEQFVEDVRRCGRGLPVAARGDGPGYLLRRFVGRHRLALAAASVSAIALFVGLLVSIVQGRYAAEQARRATAVSDFLGELLAAPSARWDTRWRGSADVSMVDVLQLASRSLTVELRDQPDVRVELYSSLARAFAALGRTSEAIDQQRRAVAIAHAELPPESSARPQARLNLAIMLDYTRTPTALAEARKQIAEGLSWHDRYAPGPSPERAALLGEVAVNLTAQGRYRDGAVQFERAIEVFHASNAPPMHPLVGVGYGLLGLAWVDAKELARARPALERSVDIQMLQGNAPTTDGLFPLGALAFIELVDGNVAESRRLAAIALDNARRVQGWRNPTTAMVLFNNALVLRETGDARTAKQLVGEAEAIIRAQPQVIPPAGFEALRLAQAEHLVLDGEPAAALDLLASIAHLQSSQTLRSVSFDHPGRYRVARARALQRLGRLEEARAEYTAALAFRRPLFGGRSPLVARIAAERAALAIPPEAKADTSS